MSIRNSRCLFLHSFSRRQYMAYSGWLIKIGDPETGYIIPSNKYIKAESYSVYVNMQDLLT